jgi:plasmid stabilization system protein ParE
MPLPLVFLRGVGQDLAGAYRWYEEQGQGLGARFLASVDRAFDDVQNHPELFARVNEEVRRASVSRFPYSIFYRVETRRVVVLAVLHSARDPNLWPKARRKPR